MNKFMNKAVQLSLDNLERGGGPFGAVIVKNNKIIAEGYNTVTNDIDPSAHAEVNAIRKACKTLNTFDLTGCDLYTSCEPCPMCYSLSMWAHMDNIYYANTKEDAANINFDDNFIYEELKKPYNERKINFIKMDNKEAIKVFEKWSRMENKTKY
jgi:guanine deaminase